eukprot:Blabericola_migrator_1__9522@NODE_517_length_7921_cov_221_621976_g395_i0_p1_GENE_NODE_517_length_7921_cov_221_621976_g395_i0NODE_517_length_7921_cov_221_621976_g395_i0_p1_ORF_typecomplete_len886_score166_30DNMT1RFD/PF12047_8/1_3e16CAF20/PF17052_5/6_2e03CAF20/PF17052_5/0_035_NODE_517_length_7921_cov_221_621976_g395_i039366593
MCLGHDIAQTRRAVSVGTLLVSLFGNPPLMPPYSQEGGVEHDNLLLSDEEAVKTNTNGGQSSACVSTVTPQTGDCWPTSTPPGLKGHHMEYTRAHDQGSCDYDLGGFGGWAVSTDSEGADDDDEWRPNLDQRKRGPSSPLQNRAKRRRRGDESFSDTADDDAYNLIDPPPAASFDTKSSPSAPTTVPSSSKPPSSMPPLGVPKLGPSDDLSSKVNLMALQQAPPPSHMPGPPLLAAQAYMKKPPFMQGPFGLHQLPSDLYPLAPSPPLTSTTSKCLTSRLLSGAPVSGTGESSDPTSSQQEALPIYQSAAQAPGRLPAHKPVRLNQPKHPLAPPGTPVYFKYGEEHYPEETIPDVYTYTESDGTICRYITNFLVYNKRGERLLPIEVLDQPRHGALVLYGSLLPSESMGNASADSSGRSVTRQASRARVDRRRGSNKRRGDDETSTHPPYPVRVELSEWCIDYGQEPQNVPFIWLISRWDVYYRLEKPAGRYIPTFASAKLKFEVSTRVIKCLQYRPDYSYREMVDLLTAASRQQKNKRRQEEMRRRRQERRSQKCKIKEEGDQNSDDDGCFGIRYFPPSLAGLQRRSISELGGSVDDESLTSVKGGKKTARPNWKVTHSLSTPEGTGVKVEMPDGREQPRTPWGAPFAVEGVTASTLLGLTDFLETQMRNFLEGVGGHCPNLLDTPLMQALRDKASLRRETIQLVEAKKRALESMATANGFPHMTGQASQFELAPPSPTPPPAITMHVGATPIRHQLPSNVHVFAAATMPGPLVAFGFPLNEARPADTGPLGMGLLAPHHPALVMLKTRHQEEQELGQLLQVLREFSDPDCDDGGLNDDLSEDDELDSGDDSSMCQTDHVRRKHLQQADDLSSAASDITAQQRR